MSYVCFHQTLVRSGASSPKLLKPKSNSRPSRNTETPSDFHVDCDESRRRLEERLLMLDYVVFNEGILSTGFFAAVNVLSCLPRFPNAITFLFRFLLSLKLKTKTVQNISAMLETVIVLFFQSWYQTQTVLNNRLILFQPGGIFISFAHFILLLSTLMYFVILCWYFYFLLNPLFYFFLM